MLRIVNRSDDLDLMPIDDPALAVEVRDGIPLYEPRVVHSSPGWFGSGIFGHRLSTLCTQTLVVARPDAGYRMVGAVADLLGLHRSWLSRRHVELR